MRLLIIFTLFLNICLGQTLTNSERQLALKEIVTFISNNSTIPDSVKYGYKPGYVYIELVIDRLGKTLSYKANSKCSQCKNEILRLLKIMPVTKTIAEKNYDTNIDLSFLFRFPNYPDSLLIYKPEDLVGKWKINPENKPNCLECPEITFNKDKTLFFISDTLKWDLEHRILTIKHIRTKDKNVFSNNKNFNIKFSEYFTILEMNSSDKKEQYILRRK